jgi:hypothetical protein
MRIHDGGGTRRSLVRKEASKSKSSGGIMSFGLAQRVEREASSPSEKSLAEWSLMSSRRGYESCRWGKVYAWGSIRCSFISPNERYASSPRRPKRGERREERRGGGGGSVGSSERSAANECYCLASQ